MGNTTIKRVLLILITGTAIVKYFYNLGSPRNIVFDEVYYGTLCKLYKEKKFSVSDQPPLARILLCSFVNLHPNNSDVAWNRIGNELPTEEFAFWVRFVPALSSVTALSVACLIVQSLVKSDYAVVVTGLLWLNDPSLLVQGRLMFCDTIVVLLQLLSLWTCIRRQWALSSIFIGLSVASHLSSIATWLSVFITVMNHHWTLLNDRRIKLPTAVRNTVWSVCQFLLLPAAIYGAVWHAHLQVVSNSGPHDHMMSSLFQTTLEGGLSSAVTPIAHGSIISIKSLNRKCYLSSHEETYPPEYEDGTKSSQQQVVFCSERRSKNIYWIVARGDHWSMTGNISHGSTIRLIHLQTMRPLTSIMNAGPISKHKGEVSCLVEHDNSPTDWVLKIINNETAEYWRNLQNFIQLKHSETNGYLSVTHENLEGGWGEGGLEVVTNLHSDLDLADNNWLVEEVKSHHKPIENITMTFIQKIVEANLVMLQLHSSSAEHRYSSELCEWPLAMSSVAYYFSRDKTQQIHLVGNPESWSGGVVAIATCIVTLIVIAAREARGWTIRCEKDSLNEVCLVFEHLVLGLLLHMLLVFYDDQTKFLHHYIPALVLKHLTHACTVAVLVSLVGWKFAAAHVVHLGRVVLAFNRFKPVTYGTFFNRTEIIPYACSAWDM